MDKSSIGKIVNILANDASQFPEFCVYFHFLLSSTFQLLYIAGLVSANIGYDALLGILFFIFLIGLNCKYCLLEALVQIVYKPEQYGSIMLSVRPNSKSIKYKYNNHITYLMSPFVTPSFSANLTFLEMGPVKHAIVLPLDIITNYQSFFNTPRHVEAIFAFGIV